MKLRDSCFDLYWSDWSNNRVGKRKAAKTRLEYLLYWNGIIKCQGQRVCKHLPRTSTVIYLLLLATTAEEINVFQWQSPVHIYRSFSICVFLYTYYSDRKKKLLTRYRSVLCCFRSRFVYRSRFICPQRGQKKYRVRTAEWNSTDWRLCCKLAEQIMNFLWHTYVRLIKLGRFNYNILITNYHECIGH